MGDFSNYEKQGAQPGQTVAYEVKELRNADGSHPLVHLEHLGSANAGLMQRMLARAGGNKDDDRELVIKYSARRLERALFSDGTPAADGDIPAFIHALPPTAFLRLVNFASDETNYCEYPIAADPQALAEK